MRWKEHKKAKVSVMWYTVQESWPSFMYAGTFLTFLFWTDYNGSYREDEDSRMKMGKRDGMTCNVCHDLNESFKDVTSMLNNVNISGGDFMHLFIHQLHVDIIRVSYLTYLYNERYKYTLSRSYAELNCNSVSRYIQQYWFHNVSCTAGCVRVAIHHMAPLQAVTL